MTRPRTWALAGAADRGRQSRNASRARLAVEAPGLLQRLNPRDGAAAPLPDSDGVAQPGAGWYHLGSPVATTRRAIRAEVVGDAGDDTGDQGADQPGDDEQAATSADVYIYGSIGGWFGASADDFVRDVAGLDVEQIVLHLNSPGGDAWDGVAIANLLRQHRAQIVVRVDGVAASAASVIAMAGDVIIMGLGAQLMIHDAWSFGVGNAGELRQAAAMLDSISNSLAATYAARTGATPEAMRELMIAETWYTAQEAVDAGLADRVATAEDSGTASGQQIVPGAGADALWDAWDSLSAADRHDLSVYAHAGRAAAPPPPVLSAPRPPGASAPGTPPPPRGGSAVELTAEQVATWRTALALPETADATAVASAVTARLTAPQQPTGLPAGMVPIDSGALESLQADARVGREAFERQERESREHLVDSCVRDGRILPAARAGYLQQLTPLGDGTAARATADFLAQLPKGTVPVTERGYSGEDTRPTDTLAAVRQDATYQGWSLRA